MAARDWRMASRRRTLPRRPAQLSSPEPRAALRRAKAGLWAASLLLARSYGDRFLPKIINMDRESGGGRVEAGDAKSWEGVFRKGLILK